MGTIAEIDKEVLISLLKRALRVRITEERIAERYAEQEMRCPVHLSIGQEATPAAVCELLSRSDIAYASHRSHGPYIAKYGSLPKLIAELYGKETGCSRGKGGSMHIIDLDAGFWGSGAIVSGTIPLAVGTAFGNKLQGKNTISAVFFGDGCTEEGILFEAINFAMLKKLPVFFVCENNLYSVYTDLKSRQHPDRDMVKIAGAHGMMSFRTDGHDIVESYLAAKKAIDHIRSGKGPAFVEFMTYRYLEHCGPNCDNDLGYRELEEFNFWKEKCPIEKYEKQLTAEGILSLQEIKEIKESINKELDKAFKFALESSLPAKEEMTKHVYAE